MTNNAVMQKIVIIGGGGHAKVLIDLIRTSENYEIKGILDSMIRTGAVVSGVSILGDDSLLPELYANGIKNVCLAVGSIKDNSKRKTLYEKVKQIGFSVPCLIHPKAIVSKETQLSEGVQMMAGAIVQTGSVIKENTIINTGAIVEHDCNIGRHIHISSGAVIAGGCIINDGAFIGAGATIIHGVKVGENSIIAAGAVVINNVPDNVKVMGVPAE